MPENDLKSLQLSNRSWHTEYSVCACACVCVCVCVCVCRGNSPLHYPWSVYNKLRDPEQTSSCHLLSSTKQALKHTQSAHPHPATLNTHTHHFTIRCTSTHPLCSHSPYTVSFLCLAHTHTHTHTENKHTRSLLQSSKLMGSSIF